MPVASADMGMLGFARRHATADFQLLQNPALLDIRPFAAALAQFQQLCLQGQQAVDPCLDVVDVLVDQRVDAFALILRAVAQAEQAADFFEGHVEGAAVTDEGQALGVGLSVQTVIAFTAGRFRQQTFALVVADGFDLAVGQFRQFTDLHCASLQKVA